MTPVFIGLGANLAEPLTQLQQAVIALQQLPQTEVKLVSSFYGSKPMGPQDQPDYVNAVALLSTELSPEQLLDALQQIEQTQGRQQSRALGGPHAGFGYFAVWSTKHPNTTADSAALWPALT